MSCVGAATSRSITRAKFGLLGPQYCGLAFISTCAVEMPDMTYGPLPADAVCRYASPVSVLSAPGWSLAPWALSTAELVMPKAGLVAINGIAGLGSLVVRAEDKAVG